MDEVKPWLSAPCDLLNFAVAWSLAYVQCDVDRDPVGDSRTGASYTARVSADVCRREATGDECVGTAQTVGRTGAEAGPTVEQEGNGVPVPNACVGSTCTPSTTVVAPQRVTIFESGTAPEVSVYTAGGAVNANAPQVCASINNTCGGTGSTGTREAGVENVNTKQLVTTQ